MARTPQQSRNVSSVIDHLVMPEEVGAFAAAATYEAHHNFGVPLTREDLEHLALGAAWVAWWADQMRERGDLTPLEHGKLHNACKAAAAMWATTAKAQEALV